jgi:hypothetical protein
VKVKEPFTLDQILKKISFDKIPVGINTLNSILPNLCKAAGFKRVTCVSKLFNSNVQDKLIRERSGHRSNALCRYEETNEEKVAHISSILGPDSDKTANKEKCEIQQQQSTDNVNVEEKCLSNSFFNSASMINCTVNVVVKDNE